MTEKLGMFRVVATRLRIFTTMPVTTATGERSLSALIKQIKNYLCATMCQGLLNGLANLYMNKDTKPNFEHVIREEDK